MAQPRPGSGARLWSVRRLVKAAAIVVLLTALAAPNGAQAASASFLAYLEAAPAAGLPHGAFSPGANTFQSASSPASLEIVKLTAASTPPRETYAVLLAGLGLLGFIARRRNKALKAAD